MTLFAYMRPTSSASVDREPALGHNSDQHLNPCESVISLIQMHNEPRAVKDKRTSLAMRFIGLYAGACLFGLFAIAAPPALADFRLCNDTTSLVGVALGYRESGKWVTEGWWQIPGETCTSLIEGDLNSRFYYLYAEDADKGGQWRGEIFMCTADREFRISGIEECFARGYQKTGFFEIDTSNKESWMVRLTEQGQTGSSTR